MPKKALSDDQIKEAAELFGAGHTCAEIAAWYGVHERTLRIWLRRAGLASTDSRVRKTDPVQLAEMYAEGKSAAVIGQELGVAVELVRLRLHAAGVAMRPAGGGGGRLACRDDAFDALTPEVCYWVGMLITDGCVTSDHKAVPDTIKLRLQSCDSDHILEFKKFAGSSAAATIANGTHPIDESRIAASCGIRICSPHMVAALEKYGVVPRKTFVAEAKGGVEASRDFWRGCVDGDGSIGVTADNGPFVKFDGASEKLVTQFRDFLKASGVRGEHSISRIQPGRHSLAVHIKYSVKLGARSALDAIALLYADGVPVLPRKARLAKMMIRRGIERELVGTFNEGWCDKRAAEWAGVPVN